MQHTYDTTGCFVGNTAHFRSKDVRYQSQPNHTISLMRFSAGPLSHSTHIHGTVPPLHNEGFLQNNNNNNNNYYYYYYLLQLGCHPVAVVILHVYRI